MAKSNKAAAQQSDQKLQSGVQQNLTQTITVGGKPYTAASIGVVLQGRIDVRDATLVALAVYQKCVAAEKAQIASSKVLVAQTKAVLLVMFAGSPEVLAAMGLSEKKVPVKSVSVKSAAIVKGAATRVARHTTGPKAKAKIKGAATVAAPAVAPSTGGSSHS